MGDDLGVGADAPMGTDRDDGPIDDASDASVAEEGVGGLDGETQGCACTAARPRGGAPTWLAALMVAALLGALRAPRRPKQSGDTR